MPGRVQDNQQVKRRTSERKFTVPVITPRLEELAKCKTVHPRFKADRTTAECFVTEAALRARASPRLKELAQPRPCPAGWEFHRSPYSVVTQAAKNAIASERLLALAKPRPQAREANSKPILFLVTIL
ncbi:sperm microtubule associated protein 2-like [Zootoca vivipara]|uniref:sperm microtubule associated protein 2-like n=1 Tax=Zootoca vivipara TaxID=8524 RepID=UPI00159259DB|nr:sperm microtubule associated protein 2-like [Zootoca vivipara]